MANPTWFVKCSEAIMFQPHLSAIPIIPQAGFWQRFPVVGKTWPGAKASSCRQGSITDFARLLGIHSPAAFIPMPAVRVYSRLTELHFYSASFDRSPGGAKLHVISVFVPGTKPADTPSAGRGWLPKTGHCAARRPGSTPAANTGWLRPTFPEQPMRCPNYRGHRYRRV